MSFDIGNMVGNRSGWPGGDTPVTKVTDLRAHVDGGTSAPTGNEAGTGAVMTMYIAAGIVVAAVILLWLMGAFAFRSHNL